VGMGALSTQHSALSTHAWYDNFSKVHGPTLACLHACCANTIRLVMHSGMSAMQLATKDPANPTCAMQRGPLTDL